MPHGPRDLCVVLCLFGVFVSGVRPERTRASRASASGDLSTWAVPTLSNRHPALPRSRWRPRTKRRRPSRCWTSPRHDVTLHVATQAPLNMVRPAGSRCAILWRRPARRTPGSRWPLVTARHRPRRSQQ